jgi:hypothetical protein
MKRTRQTIKAGERGTKKLVDKYGSDLLYVRYYYNWQKRKRITTVELIIDSRNWQPKKIANTAIVKVKIDYEEIGLREKIKEKGGKWNSERRVWELPFGKVKELGLQSRMVRR